MRIVCSASSSVSTAPRNTRAPGSGSQSPSASCSATAAGSGPKPVPVTARPSTSRSAKRRRMKPDAVEILLVEDNPNDIELTLHAFQRNHLTNRVHVVRDGAEALEFLFGTGAYAR